MSAAADAATALDAFAAELIDGGIATVVLERRSGGRVHAEVDRAARRVPAAGVVARLAPAPHEAVAYRRTRLMRGERLLSEADLWYVPERLAPAMATALASTDIPFGAAILPLAPRRRTLAIERPVDGDVVLVVTAQVVDADGRPLAEVAERYRRAALGLEVP